MRKTDIEKTIAEFAAREREAAEASKEKEENQACINPDSYMAKEIKYQTALLHQILDEIRDIKKPIRVIIGREESKKV